MGERSLISAVTPLYPPWGTTALMSEAGGSGGKPEGTPTREKLRGSILPSRRAELAVRDSSMSRRLVPAASKSTYALCSGSLIRKIELGWVSPMFY